MPHATRTRPRAVGLPGLEPIRPLCRSIDKVVETSAVPRRQKNCPPLPMSYVVESTCDFHVQQGDVNERIRVPVPGWRTADFAGEHPAGHAEVDGVVPGP